jgi:hypothetical protein
VRSRDAGADEGAEAGRDSRGNLVEQARREQLEAGAAIRLLAAGELKEVLPLDSETTLQPANLVQEGQIRGDAAKVKERRDAMVRNALKQPVAVIILGGSHDLTENADRLSRQRCEYVQVTPNRYPTP